MINYIYPAAAGRYPAGSWASFINNGGFMKRNITVLAVLAVVFATTGCDKLSQLDKKAAEMVQGTMKKAIEEKIGERIPSTPPSTPSQPGVSSTPEVPVAIKPSEDPDRDLREELNGYVECINRSQSRAQQSYDRYLSWVSKAAGPNCNERYITYGLYSLYDDSIEKCNQAAKRGAEGAPSLPELEKAAADLAKCNAELIPLVKKASDYYDQQDFKDDACAKGKEMHPQLIATFEKCFAAAKALGAGVDTLKAEADRREIAKLEAQGQSFRLHTLRLMLNSRELLKTLNTSGQGPIVTKDVYSPKSLEVEKNFQALDDYATAHKEELDKAFWGSAFLSSAKEFNTAAKFLRRALDEGKDPRSEAQSFVEQYNRMIDDANNVRF